MRSAGSAVALSIGHCTVFAPMAVCLWNVPEDSRINVVVTRWFGEGLWITGLGIIR